MKDGFPIVYCRLGVLQTCMAGGKRQVDIVGRTGKWVKAEVYMPNAFENWSLGDIRKGMYEEVYIQSGRALYSACFPFLHNFSFQPTSCLNVGALIYWKKEQRESS